MSFNAGVDPEGEGDPGDQPPPPPSFGGPPNFIMRGEMLCVCAQMHCVLRLSEAKPTNCLFSKSCICPFHSFDAQALNTFLWIF